MKKLRRTDLKNINGSGYNDCPHYCPPGPYGPGYAKSCQAFEQLPQCCKNRVLVSHECFPQ